MINRCHNLLAAARSLHRHTLRILLLVLAVSLASCDYLAAFAPVPTEPMPSATARPTNPPQVLPPTFTPLPPTATLPIPSATNVPPSRTPLPTAIPMSLNFIEIAQPGAGSKIISPVVVSGYSNSTFEQNLTVAVYDVTGKKIAVKAATIQAGMGQRGAFSVEVPFAITREQAGRVAVYDTSPVHGGTLHLASAEVTLLPPGGKAQIVTAKPAPPLIQLYTPSSGTAVNGGVINVSGFGGPIFENQFGIAVCGVGSGTGKADPVCGKADNYLAASAAILQAAAGKTGPFSARLTYSVKQKTSGWLVVYDTSARDGGLIFLHSQPIQLMP